MSEIEKLLETKIEDYESARRQALKFIDENKEELAAKYDYAAFLEQPLKEKQIFFLWENSTGGGELIQAVKKQIMDLAGTEYTCVSCETGCEDISEEDTEEASSENSVQIHRENGFVQEDSLEYWEALAVSSVIISSVPLPVGYVKREGQIYFNSMSEIYAREPEKDSDFVSNRARDFLKTDYCFAPSWPEARRIWLEHTGIGRVYDGKILVISREIPETIAAFILKKETKETLKIFSTRDKDRKKVLIMGSWKMSRGNRMLLKRMIENADQENLDVAVCSNWLGEKEERNEFLQLQEKIPLFMGRGRIPLTEEELLNYRIMEKNPDVYLEDSQLRDYMNHLARREWRRLLGECHWDVILLLGNARYLQFYLAISASAGEKYLTDLEFLPYLQERHPAKWRKALAAFERIYVPASCEQTGKYGEENRERIIGMPVFADEPEDGRKEKNLISYNGISYLVCDQWKNDNGHTLMKLVQMPEEGSILVNTAVLPSREKREQLEKLAATCKLYLVGTESGVYQSFLPDATVLDEFVKKELYAYPAARDFFRAFKGYVGNEMAEYDVLNDICRKYCLE